MPVITLSLSNGEPMLLADGEPIDPDTIVEFRAGDLARGIAVIRAGDLTRASSDVEAKRHMDPSGDQPQRITGALDVALSQPLLRRLVERNADGQITAVVDVREPG